MVGKTQYLDERIFSQKGKGGGKGGPSATQLAAACQQAEKVADEARKNRENVKADAMAREKAKQTAKEAAGAGFVGSADVFEFAAETSFMQGRADAHMDRHVTVKDLVVAGKALKMPIDTLDKPVALFSVYDGHLGTKCSEYCAQNFHKKLLPRLTKVSARREQTVEEQIRASLSSALAELDQEFMAKFWTDRSGCCVQIVLLVGRRLYAASCGNTITLLCSSEGVGAEPWGVEALHRNPHLASCPEEQKRVQLAGGAIIQVAPGLQHVACGDFEARMREYRIQNASGMGCSKAPPTSLAFSRALGDRDLKQPAKIVICEPEVRTIFLQRSHVAFALLCDGISEVMANEDVSKLLQSHAGGNEKKAAGELTQGSYNRGSEQNLMAIVVYFRWPTKRTHDQAFSAGEPLTGTEVKPLAREVPCEAPAAKQPKLAETSGERREESPAETLTKGAAQRQETGQPNARVKASGQRSGGETDVNAKAKAQRSSGDIVELLASQVPTWEACLAQQLAEAGTLLQDEDGDVAHQFLEENDSHEQCLEEVSATKAVKL
ncbi:unnamed protein product [Polarella glacialis]|uniref:PPM-type phosphatase domain-containing protein n=3 Tax=Polarella glacialis TaxID=89957 RepID=A0A813JUR2_POLGL|nr:unnamed protein product [Polarella glacialis]